MGEAPTATCRKRLEGAERHKSLPDRFSVAVEQFFVLREHARRRREPHQTVPMRVCGGLFEEIERPYAILGARRPFRSRSFRFILPSHSSSRSVRRSCREPKVRVGRFAPLVASVTKRSNFQFSSQSGISVL